jgi:hypothetical protein
MRSQRRSAAKAHHPNGEGSWEHQTKTDTVDSYQHL